MDINEKLIALVGPPNCGKTTVYNWMTGSKYKTVNYPGSTVDLSIGKTNGRFGGQLSLVDTPGLYSLSAKSPDEEVTVKSLIEGINGEKVQLIICVLDVTQLSRHILLAKQLKQLQIPMIVALSMIDLLPESDKKIFLEPLENELNCKVQLIDGRLGGGIQELINLARTSLSNKLTIEAKGNFKIWNEKQIEEELKLNQILVNEMLGVQRALDTKTTPRKATEKIDKILLHPIFGFVAFFVIMSVLFASIYSLAAPIMDLVDQSFSTLADIILENVSNKLISDFLANGLIASFGAVMVFVPQIFILFIGIALLEDSGYLARSAVLIDRPLRMIGLGGRSFVPLLSGFACAVPAMMAARTIANKKERWLTLFIIPLMSCSARLPVYALLLTFLFKNQEPWKAGLSLALLYFCSIVVGAIASGLAQKWIKADKKSIFVLELPVYRMPILMSVFRQSLNRTKGYIKRAGPVIFTLAVIVWLGTTFPKYNVESPQEKLEQSYFGQLGQSIEPIFEPMGVDWRVGLSLITAFAAREVFVSSLAVVFSVAGDDDDSMSGALIEKMSEAKLSNGQLIFTGPTVIGLIIFFMIALQCLSTTGVAIREFGGWKSALFQLILFNFVAYLMAIAIVQIF